MRVLESVMPESWQTEWTEAMGRVESGLRLGASAFDLMASYARLNASFTRLWVEAGQLAAANLTASSRLLLLSCP